MFFMRERPPEDGLLDDGTKEMTLLSMFFVVVLELFCGWLQSHTDILSVGFHMHITIT